MTSRTIALRSLADEMGRPGIPAPSPAWAARMREILGWGAGTLTRIETALGGDIPSAMLVCDTMVPGVDVHALENGGRFQAGAVARTGSDLGIASADREAWALLAATLRLVVKREEAIG